MKMELGVWTLTLVLEVARFFLYLGEKNDLEPGAPKYFKLVNVLIKTLFFSTDYFYALYSGRHPNPTVFSNTIIQAALQYFLLPSCNLPCILSLISNT